MKTYKYHQSRTLLAGFVICCLSFSCLQAFTACPSMDFTGDCRVDFEDFALFAKQWLATDPCVPDIMVYIPDGTFQMGDSFSEGSSSELPVHTVAVDAFYMGKYEVTNAQYCTYLNSALGQGLIAVDPSGVVYQAGSGMSYPYCNTSTSNLSLSQIVFSNNTFTVCTKRVRSMANDPMVMVSWYGSVAYCNWRSQQEGKQPCYDLSTWACDFAMHGYRLPTEAEWEYAARGGLSGKRFPCGDTITHSRANYYSYSFYSYDISPTRDYHPLWNDEKTPYTSPMGFFDGSLKYKNDYNWDGSANSYQTTSGASNYGLYDMAGNVWEWCNDWYSDLYYSSSPENNPTGPVSGNSRVLRGGSWSHEAYDCRVANRRIDVPYGWGGRCGFRVVLDLN